MSQQLHWSYIYPPSYLITYHRYCSPCLPTQAPIKRILIRSTLLRLLGHKTVPRVPRSPRGLPASRRHQHQRLLFLLRLARGAKMLKKGMTEKEESDVAGDGKENKLRKKWSQEETQMLVDGYMRASVLRSSGMHARSISVPHSEAGMSTQGRPGMESQNHSLPELGRTQSFFTQEEQQPQQKHQHQIFPLHMLLSSHSVPVSVVGPGVGSGGDMYDLPFLDCIIITTIIMNGSAGMGMNIDAVVPDNFEMKEHHTNNEVIARHQKRSGLVDEVVGTSGYFTNAHDFVISDSAFYDNSAWYHTDNSIHYINTVNSVDG
ncbi:hypothetical protein BDQ17DRAFT_1412520 [Cyathus striatus]|nr:hypothetical protein BDQ17DRAFT_1412520 [Cyathus striatus]